MYRFVSNGALLYADRWALYENNLVAISTTGGITAVKTANAMFLRSARDESFTCMLYDNDNPRQSPGTIKVAGFTKESSVRVQTKLPEDKIRGSWQNLFAWKQGQGDEYFVITPPGQEHQAPRLWHRMMEEREDSMVISIRDWADVIWEQLVTRLCVHELRGYNLSGYHVQIGEGQLQELICKLVADGHVGPVSRDRRLVDRVMAAAERG